MAMQSQLHELIRQLENKPNLAKIDRISTPKNFDEEWEHISGRLNLLGPSIMDTEGWQKVWRDYRYTLYKKLKSNKAEANSIEGDIPNLSALSDLEKRAFYILHHKPFYTEFSKQGNQIPLVDLTTQENGDDLPSTSAQAISMAKKKAISKKGSENHENAEQNESFERDIVMRNGVPNDINNTLREIKETTEKLYENTKIDNRYQQKLLEVEEKKLKALERKHYIEEELFKNKILTKDKELEMIQKEWELLKIQL